MSIDKYERFLITRTLWYWLWCRADAEKMGRPEQPHFADRSMRYTYEAYEACLDEYRRFKSGG